MIDENKFKPLHVTASKFRTAKDERISTRTIRRYVHRAGIRNYNAVSKPYLTRNHINARLHWAIMRLNWIHMDWNNVMFSDESSFTVRPLHLRKRVWRKNGTRFRTSNLILTFKSGYVSLSIWGGFSKQGRTDLVRIRGNLNQHKYKQILSRYVIPFASTKHQGLRNFLFQQDGCGPHRAKSIKQYLDAENVRVLPWPAQSPDLNPI